MKNYSFGFICFLLLVLSSCTEDKSNPVKQFQTQSLLYQKSGLIDSIVGTCSSYLISTVILDTLDFRQFNTARFQRVAYTNANLSEINIYYLNADTAVSVLHLQGSNQINSTGATDFQPPKIKTKFYLRLKLFSSVCTGDLFHLKLRDVNIFGLN
jgi:hypothetical protein